MRLLIIILQCGAFLIIPSVTFGLGIKKLLQIQEKYHRIGIAGLIGFVSFEASIIGMLIDPRSDNYTFIELILTSLVIGLVAFAFVLLGSPIGIAILNMFRR